MALFGSGAKERGDRKSVTESGNDALQLVVDYLKQETLEPLQGLGRFLIFGVAGSLALAIGLVLLLVALLRLLQTETGAFHGNLSWIPYLIVSAVGLGVIGLAAWRVTSGPGQRKLPESGSGAPTGPGARPGGTD